jgi:hypothetical protein
VGDNARAIHSLSEKPAPSLRNFVSHEVDA